MNQACEQPIRYSILDPTGNITALVESDVAIERQPLVALEIMKRHPLVEQVGYLRHAPVGSGPSHGQRPNVTLRMAGGEFCGNASMCAAALYLMRRDASMGRVLDDEASDAPNEWKTVWLRVSGAAQLIEARLQRTKPGRYVAQIHMPSAVCIEERELEFGQVRELLPVVRMEGISHIVVQDGSAFAQLLVHPFEAEQAICTWCEVLQADGLGLMFLEGEGSMREMTPLVYVPGSGTVFWENSCASGSSAVGRYLAEQIGAPVSLSLSEPGGILHVQSDPQQGETWLHGNVRYVESLTL